MIKLAIPSVSAMDNNLENAWLTDLRYITWIDFIKDLDNNILNAVQEFPGTIITFKTEQAKIMFILRWS